MFRSNTVYNFHPNKLFLCWHSKKGRSFVFFIIISTLNRHFCSASCVTYMEECRRKSGHLCQSFQLQICFDSKTHEILLSVFILAPRCTLHKCTCTDQTHTALYCSNWRWKYFWHYCLHSRQISYKALWLSQGLHWFNSPNRDMFHLTQLKCHRGN